jgi:hypothetical protein
MKHVCAILRAHAHVSLVTNVSIKLLDSGSFLMTISCSVYTLTNGTADELSLAEGATSANFGALDLLLTVLDAILYLASSSSCSSPHRQLAHA